MDWSWKDENGDCTAVGIILVVVGFVLVMLCLQAGYGAFWSSWWNN